MSAFLFITVTNTTLTRSSGHVTLHTTLVKCLWQGFVSKNAFHQLHNMTIVGLTIVQAKPLDNGLKILTTTSVKQIKHTIITAHVGI